MARDSSAALRRRLAQSRWLRALFAFRFLAGAMLFTAGTGLFLRGMDRFGGLAWGLSEWGHVVVGWVALPLFLGYLLHHVAKRWGSLGSFFRLLGLALAATLGLALLSGVLLDQVPAAGSWSGVRTLHYVATFPILALLVLHPARIALAKTALWMRSLRQPRSPRSDS